VPVVLALLAIEFIKDHICVGALDVTTVEQFCVVPDLVDEHVVRGSPLGDSVHDLWEDNLDLTIQGSLSFGDFFAVLLLDQVVEPREFLPF
jgi:hypothetical protein